MKKKFTEEQIIGILKQHEKGVPVKELIRQYNLRNRHFTDGSQSMAGWKSATPES